MNSVPPFISDWSPEDHLRVIAEMQKFVGKALEALLQREGLQQGEPPTFTVLALSF